LFVNGFHGLSPAPCWTCHLPFDRPYWIERTFENRPNSVKLPLGYFANVIDVGNELAIALSTDHSKHMNVFMRLLSVHIVEIARRKTNNGDE